MNKGDVILLVILGGTAAAFGLNQWNVMNGYPELNAYQWQFLQALFCGELLFFALYRIGKHTAQAITVKRGGGVPERLEQEDLDEREKGACYGRNQ